MCQGRWIPELIIKRNQATTYPVRWIPVSRRIRLQQINRLQRRAVTAVTLAKPGPEKLPTATVLDLEYKSDPSPHNSTGSKGSGSLSLKSDGTLSMDWGCRGDAKK